MCEVRKLWANTLYKEHSSSVDFGSVFDWERKGSLSTGAWSRCQVSEKIFRPCRILRIFFFSLPSKSSQVLLEAIIATTAMPCTVIKNMAFELIQIEIDPSAHVEKGVVARFLLSLIQQRHPLPLQSAIDALQEDDVTSKETLDHLLLSLSTVRAHSSSQKHF